MFQFGEIKIWIFWGNTIIFPKWNVCSPERKPTTYFVRNCWKRGPTFGRKMVTFCLFSLKRKNVASRIWMFHFWKYFNMSALHLDYIKTWDYRKVLSDYIGITKQIIGLQKKCWDYIGVKEIYGITVGLQKRPSELFFLTVD